MVAHAIVRHRLMDVRLVIHRSLTFTLALVVSLLPVAGLLALAWPRLSDHLAPEELAALILAVVAVSLLIPLTRDAAGRLLDRYVYRTQVNYQRTLREASKALTRVLDLKVLLPFLNHTVAISTNSEGAAVYLSDCTRLADADSRGRSPRSVMRTATSIRRRGARGCHRGHPGDERSVARGRDRPRIAQRRPRAPPRRARAPRLGPRPALISEDTVIGAIVVGPKLSGDPFYPQDLDLLMTLANQAGIAIKNAQLYAQVVLANEYISRTSSPRSRAGSSRSTRADRSRCSTGPRSS